MHHFIIQSMLQSLKPVLKDKARAERLLECFWQDKIALVWDTEDVHRAANEIEVALTETEARELLHDLHEHHNPQYGLQWKDVTEQIRDDVLGRAMTKQEVNRFVKKDILTIHR
ncbi:hypothetical protein NXS98_06140 [Fontisphaera persica]|uniref:hypothetical protein n=1 Tax=Fontisphaera persica TaxID=2974023 RepID=UPI0024BF968F|nr:hypothetical protein [Fontisphaera persica]WCJ60704.1 hypothetical protein NXS98_06140 [Fontisphaera persica]